MKLSKTIGMLVAISFVLVGTSALYCPKDPVKIVLRGKSDLKKTSSRNRKDASNDSMRDEREMHTIALRQLAMAENELEKLRKDLLWAEHYLMILEWTNILGNRHRCSLEKILHEFSTFIDLTEVNLRDIHIEIRAKHIYPVSKDLWNIEYPSFSYRLLRYYQWVEGNLRAIITNGKKLQEWKNRLSSLVNVKLRPVPMRARPNRTLNTGISNAPLANGGAAQAHRVAGVGIDGGVARYVIINNV